MSLKIFDRLYTLDSKKKIRVFDCRIEQGVINAEIENEFSASKSDSISIITATGLLGGKLIEQTTLVKAGKNVGKKNETDVLAQAMLQADSLWREKLDEGYKTHRMLTFKLVSLELNESIYEENVLAMAIKHCPEFAYTNSNWDELPMLAHKWKDIKKPVFPYIAQPKLNGVRCLAKKRVGEYPFTKLTSRGGTYYVIPHLISEVSNLFDKLAKSVKGNYLLDGELYYHGRPLQDISGAARKQEDGLFTSNEWLEYHIYDVINLDDPKESQRQRYMHLCLINLINDQPHIRIVETTPEVNDHEQVKFLHDKYVADGYEGLILRTEHGEYTFNERSKSLLKVKQYQDEEFLIIGSEIDENKDIAKSFVFVLKNNINDLTFKARPTGSNEQKYLWYAKPQLWINKKATVRFFERSKDGLPQQGSVQHKLTEVLHVRPKGE